MACRPELPSRFCFIAWSADSPLWLDGALSPTRQALPGHLRSALVSRGADCDKIKSASPTSETLDTVTVAIACKGDASYRLTMWYNGDFSVATTHRPKQ